MPLLTIVLVVALVLLIFGGFRASGPVRPLAWFLVVVLAVYLALNLT